MRAVCNGTVKRRRKNNTAVNNSETLMHSGSSIMIEHFTAHYCVPAEVISEDVEGPWEVPLSYLEFLLTLGKLGEI